MTEPLQTTPMRAAESNTRPVVDLPAGSCDTHFHVFEPGYSHVAKTHYTFPDGTLEQYLRLTDFLGIERMVLVQPSYYGTDNTLALDVLRRVGSRCRGVVQVDEHVTDRELDHYHDVGVRAIRLDLFARADQPTTEIIDYVRRMARRTKPRGWHLQFYTPGTIVRDLLPFLADFEEPFVIDHMGYMKEADGLTRPTPIASSMCSSTATAGSNCPARTASPRTSRSRRCRRSDSAWSRLGPIACAGGRTGRTSPTDSATPANY